jgi:UDP-glucose 4-epimerase
MKIFLTGGTGFIGSYVARELSRKGHYVSILARNPKKVPALEKLPGIEIIAGDITDFNTIKKMMAGKDVCIHIALHWGNTAVEMLLNDTHSSVKIFELAAVAGVKEIIYTSSTAVNDWVYMDESSRTGGEKNTVFENTKQQPVSYYGATKGATELYLNAIAFNYKIKANIIRPGYTFGNPVVTGANMQSDKRFSSIVENARRNESIELIKNDGTQFIWAGDLAKIYSEIIDASVNGKMYFGLGNRFITWESIANETVSLLGSKSKIIIKDLGWPDKPALFDVEAIKRDFGLSFDSMHHIKEHIRYLAYGD